MKNVIMKSEFGISSFKNLLDKSDLEREKMNSSENMGQKINADATHPETILNSMVPKESVMNPVLKDQKRVVRKMIVMNTNKLKELGIEATVKNAMSKLEKGNNIRKLNKTSLYKPVTVQSTLGSSQSNVHSKLVSSTVPTMKYAHPTVESSKSKISTIKQVVEPTVVSSKSTIPVKKVVIYPTLVSSKSTNPTFKHVVQPTLAYSKPSTTFVHKQHMKSNSFQNAFENSEAVVINSNAVVETHTKDVDVASSVNSTLHETIPTVIDAKKIKILSDVSLNDTKAKLLEIDKISSKNLKLTNVIKGTDTSSLVNKSFNTVKKHAPTSLSIPASFKIILPTLPPSNVTTDRHIQISTPSEPKKLISRKSPIERARSHENTIGTDTSLLVNKSFNTEISPPIPASMATSVKILLPTSNMITERHIQISTPSEPKKLISRKSPIERARSHENAISTDTSSLVNKSFNTEISPPIPASMATPVKVLLPTSNVVTERHIQISIPSEPKKGVSRKGNFKPCPIEETRQHENTIWAVKPPRTYARDDVKRLLNAKIMEKTRCQTEAVGKINFPKNEQTSALIPIEVVASEIEADDAINILKYHIKVEKVTDTVDERIQDLEAKHFPTDPLPRPVKSEPIEAELTDATAPETHNRYFSSSPNAYEFNGFTVDEVNQSATDWNRIKSFLLKRISKQTCCVEHTSSTANVGEKMDLEPTNDSWILNCETGVMEQVPENIDFKNNEICNKALPTERVLSTRNTELNTDSLSKQQLKETVTIQQSKSRQPLSLITQVLEGNMSIAHTALKLPITPNSPVRNGIEEPTLSLSSIPISPISIIEDADDEISDIDTVRRRKMNFSMNDTATSTLKNRREILKSFEIHRKICNPATTDDESELSLSVRPPRPKLRKLRHKQTTEQIKIQQNAHVNLLKRFNTPDSLNNVWNDEAIVGFINGLSNRIDALDGRVKSCFDRNDETIVSFVDELPNRIYALDGQVKSCFDHSVVQGTNSKNVSMEEESILHVDSVAGRIVSVEQNVCSMEVNDDVPIESVIVCESQLPKTSLSKSSENIENVDGTIEGEGQSKIHKVTIQKDTFLVTEYEDHCDQTVPTPSISHLKLEKEESPQTCSFNTIHLKKNPASVRRKKKPRQSLVQMLAQCVDNETLKTVILAHEQQKCIISDSDDDESSLESDDTDSDSDQLNANVNNIFKTIFTIDLCDDDDETLHEDVIQLLNENRHNDGGENVEASVSMCSTNAVTSPKANTNDTQPSKATDNQLRMVKIKSEIPEVSCKPLNTLMLVDHVTSTEKNTPVPLLLEENSSEEIIKSNAVHFGETLIMKNVFPEEEVIPLRLTENEDSVTRDTESNSTMDFVDSENLTAFHTIAANEEVGDATSDVSKFGDADEVIEKEKSTLQPLGQTSNGLLPKSTNDCVKQKLSFDDALSQTDSIFTESNPKQRRVHKDEISKESDIVEPKITEDLKVPDTSSNSKKNQSRRSKKSPKSAKRSTGKISVKQEQMLTKSDDMTTKLSSIDEIRIKLENEPSDRKSQEPNLTAHEPMATDIPKPSRSRKRKVDEPIPALTIIMEDQSTPKRPKFENFETPEILTTKRTRKTKCYADCEVTSIDADKPKSRSARRSNRKPIVSNETIDTAANVLPKSEPVAQSDIQLSSDVIQTPVMSHDSVPESRTEVENNESSVETQVDLVPAKTRRRIKLPEVTNVCELREEDEKEVSSVETKVDLVPLKTGRGIKPPKLANVCATSLYTCGNCKEEVKGRDWKKHMKTHYGLAWRNGIDPPYDLENTHSIAQRIIYYTKKENIRFLKCTKCGVEKRSALGYMSHIEICGLTDEEVRSKLVKCQYCPSMVRTCSVKSHESLCSGLKRLIAKENAESSKECDSPTKDDHYSEHGRVVRQSAQKALTSFKELDKLPVTKVEDYIRRVEKVSIKQHRKWMQLLKKNDSIDCVRNGCSFTAEDMPTMLDHINTCVLISGETFYCTRCDYGPDNRNVIEEHIKASHSLGVIEGIDDKDFSDSDDDADVGEESSESEGDSGDDESLEKEFEPQNDDFDDDDDGWNARGYKKKRIRNWGHNEVMINSCLDRKVLNEHATVLRSYSSGSFFYPALEWTQDFRDKHFSNEELLPFAVPNTFSVLCPSLTEAYTPKVSKSNKFFSKEVRKYNKQFGSTQVNKTDQWKTLKKFEAVKEDDSIAFFAGGPIVSMAWLPVPDDHTLSQILVVCCRNDPNEHILLNNEKQTKCLIQIWNINNLKNDHLRHAQTPNLLYSIAYDYGPVIQMEFCPSGGFTEDRLGLLAVSSSDGHVDVLALPKNFTCDNSSVHDLVFVIEPSLILCCDLEKPLGVLMTKLVWSQSKGHTKLAAGYSNGLVAIWNLKNLDSPNICNKTNGIPTLLPTDMFFASHSCIRLLEFHHDEKNEARWLVVGSHDRKVRFYDTHNVFLEISTTLAHSRIVAGCWPMHWTTFLIGIDNAYSFKVAGIVVKQPLDIGSRTGTFYSCIGSTCDISFNNWLNSYVFVSSYGDIYVGYVRQMLSGFTDVRRQRFIIGYTDMIDIKKLDCNDDEAVSAEDSMPNTNEPQPSTSSAVMCEQADEISYPTTNGIVFCDFDTPLPAITSPTYEKIRAPPMGEFNMVKVNRILFNPNVSAYKLYALGYESGFVRIKHLKPK